MSIQDYPESLALFDQNAAQATRLMKTLAHEGRLRILCHLATGEKSVGELEYILKMRQASVSQLLARLREDKAVVTRRSGKTIYYSLADPTVSEIISVLYARFCATEVPQNARPDTTPRPEEI